MCVLSQMFCYVPPLKQDFIILFTQYIISQSGKGHTSKIEFVFIVFTSGIFHPVSKSLMSSADIIKVTTKYQIIRNIEVFLLS